MSKGKSRVAETTSYDPRHERAQTITGAKARYISHDVEYGIRDLERDIERVLTDGEYLDESPKESATRELFSRRV